MVYVRYERQIHTYQFNRQENTLIFVVLRYVLNELKLYNRCRFLKISIFCFLLVFLVACRAYKFLISGNHDQSIGGFYFVEEILVELKKNIELKV